MESPPSVSLQDLNILPFEVRTTYDLSTLTTMLMIYVLQDYVKKFKQEIEEEDTHPLGEHEKKELFLMREEVRRYSDEMVQKWNDEINGLLTFVSPSITPYTSA